MFVGDKASNGCKTTTIIGKWENQIENIWNTGLAKQGSNKGGMNILGDVPNGTVQQTWDFNKNWLNQAISRGDEIRVTANPLNINNVFYDTNNISSSVFTNISHLKSYLLSLDNDRVSQLGYYGREIRHLFQNGYHFDDFSKKFVK